MSKHLLLFTIGPVQSFIAQARKTHDLFAGSGLISDLIHETMKRLDKDSEIIFPGREIESKPNRFIAIIDCDNPGELAKNLEDFVIDKFRTIAEISFNEKCKGRRKPDNFDIQVINFLEVYWVIPPYEETDYKGKYIEIEQMLGAIKNIRKFAQLSETGRKCSVCGERNALFYNSIGNKKPRDIQNDAIKIETFDIGFGEGLCAVCFTKRFYKDDMHFPSTAKIALMDTLKKMEDIRDFDTSTNGQKLLDKYNNFFKSTHFDEQLYYEENLNDKYFEKQGLDSLKNKLYEIRKKQKELVNFAKDNKLQLSKYYAAFAFDGDDMGKWLSGDKIHCCNINSKQPLLEFHKELSKNLGKFAGWAKDYLDNEHRGGTVYAGGEDFLGFINLNHMLITMKELRENFKSFVNDPLNKFFKDKDSEITFSAGVAIAHYKTPLSEVLSWARKMEEEAKAIDDNKNAFAIAVLKHLGDISKTVVKWNDETSMIEIYKKLIDKLKNDSFSNTFIKNLNQEFSRLLDNESKFEEKELVEIEIKRLVARSCIIKREIDEKKDSFEIRKKATIEEMVKIVKLLYSNSINLANFLSALNIADFIERGINHDN